MKNKRKYKDLLKNIILFFISSFVPKAISFFLLPFYTSHLSTFEYGISDLINTTVSLCVPILTLDITDAVLRFSLDGKYDKKDIFSTAMKIILIDVLILIILYFVKQISGFPNIENIYFIFFIIYFITNSCYNIFVSFCKGINSVNSIVIASIINSLVTLLLNILLVGKYEKGLTGYLLANSLGMIVAIASLVFTAHLNKYLILKKNKSVSKEMIKYSFPMIFSAIAWWCNTASDRYIVSWMIGIDSSGVYAISSKIPTIINTFQGIFMQAWSISAIKEFDKKDEDGFIGNIFTLLFFFLTLICSLLMILNPFLSKILFANEFYKAWKFVPPLLLAVTIDGITLFMCHLFYAVRDTKARAIATICGAVVNTILNFILIKFFGAYGAAIATLIGYFTSFIISSKYLKKYIIMKTNNKRNNLILILLLLQMILAYFENKFIIIQLFIFFVIIFLFRKDFNKIIIQVKKMIKNKKSSI